MPTQVRDLYAEALAASQLQTDHRWKKWVKWVDHVDPQGTDGYAFQGDFVSTGTVQVETGRPRILLVASTTGSAKYQTTAYRAVRLEADGTLTATDVQADNSRPGWALRLRDSLAALVAACAAPPAAPQTDLEWLRAALPALSEAELVAAALVHYRRYVESQMRAETARAETGSDDEVDAALFGVEFYARHLPGSDDELKMEAAAELPAFVAIVQGAQAADRLSPQGRAFYTEYLAGAGVPRPA